MSQFNDAVLIDGLVIARFSRAVFEDMLKGGITAANCTCCVWHDFDGTMANLSQWLEWFDVHGDIIMPVHTAGDIEKAKEAAEFLLSMFNDGDRCRSLGEIRELRRQVLTGQTVVAGDHVFSL